ncbi:MAG: DUF3667 domain-containing protein [Thermonemataceae bacterium]|nr:DUF3667 domain-containing protein [Thermonemataceae bacterium]
MLILQNALKNGTHCPNCNTLQSKEAVFCHHCGQKHLEVRKSWWIFIKEFLDNNFGFDSKIFRTSLYLLFRPGRLSLDFIEGKRNAFLPPIRVYLFFSVIFFAGLASSFPKEEDNFGKEQEKIQKAIQTEKAYQTYLAELHLSESDSLSKTLKKLFKEDLDFLATKRKNFITIEGLGKKSKIYTIDIYTLSAEQILKKYEITGTLEKLLVVQNLKIIKNPNRFLQDFVASKLWWATLLMIPFVALLLKLLYIRSKRYYAEHLIFSIHYFSFTLIIGTPIFYLEQGSFIQNSYFFAYYVIGFIYQLLAQKFFYEQKWFKTVLKAVILQVVSFIAFLFFIILAAIVGMLLV